jgi:hypothetical protein
LAASDWPRRLHPTAAGVAAGKSAVIDEVNFLTVPNFAGKIGEAVIPIVWRTNVRIAYGLLLFELTYLLGSWESVMDSGLPSSVTLSPTS